MANRGKGLSSYQLDEDVGMTQKTAWFVEHRIREMMRMKDGEKLQGVVEVDQGEFGGKKRTRKTSKGYEVVVGGKGLRRTLP